MMQISFSIVQENLTHLQSVRSIAIQNDLVVSGSTDKTVGLWEFK